MAFILENLHLFYGKELSFCHNLYFSNLYIFATQCRRPLIFQTMNSVRPNNLSLKQQRFTSSDCEDIGIRHFVTKTQFLCPVLVKTHFLANYNLFRCFCNVSTPRWTRVNMNLNRLTSCTGKYQPKLSNVLATII